MQKDDYISLLSKASDRYGNLLIQMMDHCNADNLQALSDEQIKEFYEKWKENQR